MREPDTDTGGAAVPPTVLVTDMGDGALLQGLRVGQNAHVCAADAGAPREALAAAFGSDLVSGRPAVMQAHP